MSSAEWRSLSRSLVAVRTAWCSSKMQMNCSDSLHNYRSRLVLSITGHWQLGIVGGLWDSNDLSGAKIDEQSLVDHLFSTFNEFQTERTSIGQQMLPNRQLKESTHPARQSSTSISASLRLLNLRQAHVVLEFMYLKQNEGFISQSSHSAAVTNSNLESKQVFNELKIFKSILSQKFHWTLDHRKVSLLRKAIKS